MNEWEAVRQKLKELQTSPASYRLERTTPLEDLAAAEYWKRRFEEEKNLWEKRFYQKEKEQEDLQKKYLNNERDARELFHKIKELEDRLRLEETIWEERSKNKVMEAEIGKTRVEWDSKLHALEDENQHLRARIRQGIEATERESLRRKEIEEDKQRMQEELKVLEQKITDTEAKEEERIRAMELEKQKVEESLRTLQEREHESLEKCQAAEQKLAYLAREQNERLLMLAEREKEQSALFEDFTKGVVHRVRNHLGIMSGTLQLCLSNFTLDDNLKKQLNLIHSNAQTMFKTIEEALTISKVPEMSMKPVKINELVSSVLYSSEEEARLHNVRIVKNFIEPIPTIQADSSLLAEALRHIVRNAIEFSPSQGKVSVSTRFEPHTSQVVVQIEDEGKGILETHLNKVFQPYFTTRKGKKGLGLSIAKRAVNLHNGSLSFTSAKDHGTMVTVQIPVFE